eukprot:TRINITY_DN747_c0_g1_i1.p1 TRINITY_DN747_c0_g1~~TRINITY_DN747_c0_g1_i1.p1  ORF type:complete len:1499 (-),score=358.84 TRINITY_DN747_c0_g1_i1:89-4585(-)
MGPDNLGAHVLFTDVDDTQENDDDRNGIELNVVGASSDDDDDSGVGHRVLKKPLIDTAKGGHDVDGSSPRPYNHEEEAGFLSTITFSFITPLLRVGRGRPIEHSDFDVMMKGDHPMINMRRVEEEIANRKESGEWDRYVSVPRWKRCMFMWRIFVSVFGKEMIFPCILQQIAAALNFAAPVSISYIVTILSTEGTSDHRDVVYWAFAKSLMACVGVLFALLAKSAFLHQSYQGVMRTGMRVRGAFVMIIYDKCLALSPSGRLRVGSGKIVNLVATDADKVERMFWSCFYLWASPISIVICLSLLVSQIGILPTIASLTAVILLLLTQTVVGRVTASLRKKMLVHTDARMSLVNEIIQGIRALKSYAWEICFADKVTEIREKELTPLFYSVYLGAINDGILNAGPTLIAMCSFIVAALVSPELLTPARTFAALTLFNLLRMPLNVVPQLVTTMVNSTIAMERLHDVLVEDEVDHAFSTALPSSSSSSAAAEGEDLALSLENGLFTWTRWNDAASASFDKFGAGDGDDGGSQKDDDVEEGEDDSDDYAIGAGDLDDDPETSTTQLLPVGGMRSNDGDDDDDDKEETVFVLRVPRLSFKSGDLVLIVGKVGAGKSSLISSLLGETHSHSQPSHPARLRINGKLAYCSQNPWIVNDTLRNNILFGSAFDATWYNTVIEACALLVDLSVLPFGDMTEIGEKGVNVSGGQQARISLARAVYNKECDIYLLDDVLSAVDHQVASHIFNRCILGILGDKTRVLVTHHRRFLQSADWCVVLKTSAVDHRLSSTTTSSSSLGFVGIESVIEFQGHPSDLDDEFTADLGFDSDDEGDDEDAVVVGRGGLNDDDGAGDLVVTADGPFPALDAGVGGGGDAGPVSRELTESSGSGRLSFDLSEGDGDSGRGGFTDDDDDDEANRRGAALMDKEEREMGQISLAVFLNVCRSYGTGILGAVFILILCNQCMRLVSYYWLAKWSSQAYDLSVMSYLGVYACFSVTVVVFLVTAYVIFAYGSFKTSRSLHGKLLASIVSAPCHFFDRTPAGRILNRFSTDIDVLDTFLLPRACSTLRLGTRMVAIFIMLMVIAPVLALIILPVCYMFFVVLSFFLSSAREIKRLEKISKSPVVSHLEATLDGLSTIRAYGHEVRFTEKMGERLEYNLRAFWSGQSANRWLGVRLECLGISIVFSTAVAGVLTSPWLGPSMVGLAMSQSLGMIAIMNWTVRQYTETEYAFTSVERLLHYSHKIEQEAPLHYPDDPLPSEWPTRGDIVCDRLSVQYREDLPRVLDEVSFRVNSCEKIGICGRTGAGKSSLLSSFFRLVEPGSGSISIDGVDTMSVGLHTLRSRMSIIPQSPLLFSATVRYNIDPLAECTDAELWSALERVRLKETIGSMPMGLDTEVAQSGENLSVGQRQLVCLARALLRRAKILVLDEATASVDSETDDFIQEMVRKEFSECTIITVAHRVQTIHDYDRVLVLDAGKVVDFDTPFNLMHKEDSLYADMIRAGEAL